MKNLRMEKEHGFTLIEMMIVLVIISILLLIAIPNLTKNQEIANKKGCEATVELIRTQKIAYEIETGEEITTNEDLEKLVDKKYIETLNCPNSDDPVKLADLDLNFEEENGS